MQWKKRLSRLRDPGAKETEERHTRLGAMKAVHTATDVAHND
jgi:hypothetical protein